jgi:hypothetical protein
MWPASGLEDHALTICQRLSPFYVCFSADILMARSLDFVANEISASFKIAL